MRKDEWTPHVVRAINMYESVMNKFISVGNIHGAFHIIKIMNCVIWKEYQVEILKDNVGPVREDQINEFKEPVDLRGQLLDKRNRMAWINEFYDKIRNQLIKSEIENAK